MGGQQQQRRVRRGRMVATAGVVAILASGTILAGVASAATWPPTVTVTETDGTYTVTVEGAVEPSCGRQGASVEVTVPGGHSAEELLPQGGEFTVVVEGLTDPGPHDVTAAVVGGTPQCPEAAVVTTLAPPVWTDDVLPASVTEGADYDDAVAATGNPVPTYSLVDGDLPTGLVLDETTGAVTGKATEVGEFDFTLAATNSEGFVEADFTVEVLAAVVDSGTKTPVKKKTKTVAPVTPDAPSAPVTPVTPVTPAAPAAPVAEALPATIRRAEPTLAATGTGAVALAAVGSLLLAMGAAMATAGRRREDEIGAAMVVAAPAPAGSSIPWAGLAITAIALASGRERSAKR